MEEVQYWFEGVVGLGFWLDDSVVEGEDEGKVVGVEKKVNSERSQSRKRGGGEGVSATEFSGQKECEVSIGLRGCC